MPSTQAFAVGLGLLVLGTLGVAVNDATQQRQSASERCDKPALTDRAVTPAVIAGRRRTITQVSCPTGQHSPGHAAVSHYVYGDCRATPTDGGCQPPLQLAITANRQLSLDALLASARDGLAPELSIRRVEGRRVASRAGGREQILELNGLTVLIFAHRRADADSARNAVLNRSTP